jgi:hypothetical protein
MQAVAPYSKATGTRYRVAVTTAATNMMVVKTVANLKICKKGEEWSSGVDAENGSRRRER